MGIEEHARRLIEGALADLAREGALPPAVLGATFVVDRPKRAEHGDVATNAPLALQKLAQRPPRMVRLGGGAGERIDGDRAGAALATEDDEEAGA